MLLRPPRRPPGHRSPRLVILAILYLASPTTAALGDLNRIHAVQGSRVVLTCGKSEAAVLLVVWYKGDEPIYSYDNRDMMKPPSRWVSESGLGVRAGRANAGGDPAALVLDPLLPIDTGEFRCRVDYRNAPTKNSRIYVSVIVPPQKPTIFDERGREVLYEHAGPYPEDSDLKLTCMVSKGTPPPSVQWWRDDVLVDSADTSSAYPDVRANQLIVRGLQRKDKGATYVCKATNTDLAPPVTSSVTIDVYLQPSSLYITSENTPLSAGRSHKLQCEALGSHPPPSISWWLGDIQLSNYNQKDTEEGNVSISTLTFTPKREDNGKILTCRAKNNHIDAKPKETVLQLDIYYIPKTKLHLGTSLNPEDIEEGDDVYFECKVISNPAAYKVVWKHNGQVLQHNQKAGIITSSSHLAIQNVERSHAGNYSCTAFNVEGDGDSNIVNLKVMYKPICNSEQKRLYGLARGEKASVSCSVESYPAPKAFRWVFNNTAETRELQEPQPEEKGEQYSSSLNYTPTSEMDYGTILCWASNLAGKQIEPCVFHVIAGGKPDPPYNCTLLNQTTESVDVDCLGGFDGGQAQSFIFEVYDQQTGLLQVNVSSPNPHFVVGGLMEGTKIYMAIYAANNRGRSEAASLEGFTLKKAEKQTGQVSSMEMKPFIGIFIGVAITLVIMSISALIIIKVRGKPQLLAEPQQPSLKNKGAVPLASETESLYGDKNPDVIQFNKESDYQLGGAADPLPGPEEWCVPQMGPGTAPANAQHLHFSTDDMEELQFGDINISQQINYLVDPHGTKMNYNAPTYGSLDYGKVGDPCIAARPVREIVTVRTPLMLNHQQESCV